MVEGMENIVAVNVPKPVVCLCSGCGRAISDGESIAAIVCGRCEAGDSDGKLVEEEKIQRPSLPLVSAREVLCAGCYFRVEKFIAVSYNNRGRVKLDVGDEDENITFFGFGRDDAPCFSGREAEMRELEQTRNSRKE